MDIEPDLSTIRHLASVREEENIRFRTFLKSKDDAKVDSIVHRLHDEIVKQIDCTLCGNCCCVLKPQLYGADITLLARMENITPENYESDYCEEKDGEVFFKTGPCRYLEGKRCGIYEIRLKECRRFPYTDETGFMSRLWGMLEFYAICPIVFNLMERLKREFRFH